MPWSWVISVDFQLYVFIPFYVILFKKSRIAGLTLAWLMIVTGSVIIGLIASHYNFTAGIYTVENYELYAQIIIKPYCKLQVHGLGILSAILYLDILDYRK
jgi:hypothetical protein